jgi:hypothetical protein
MENFKFTHHSYSFLYTVTAWTGTSADLRYDCRHNCQNNSYTAATLTGWSCISEALRRLWDRLWTLGQPPLDPATRLLCEIPPYYNPYKRYQNSTKMEHPPPPPTNARVPSSATNPKHKIGKSRPLQLECKYAGTGRDTPSTAAAAKCCPHGRDPKTRHSSRIASGLKTNGASNAAVE